MADKYILVLGVFLLILAFALVAWVIWLVERIFSRFNDDRQAQSLAAGKVHAELREEIQALTQALGRSADIPVIYPRRRPLEPGEGWFDGKPEIRSVKVGQ